MRYDKQSIQQKLRLSQRWRVRALLMLWSEQTSEEQRQGETIFHNARGFGGTDAKRLSAAARLVAKGELPRGVDFMLQRRLPKYWRQIVEAITRTQSHRLARAGRTFVELRDAQG